MKIPNRQNAIVSPAKLTRYLLSNRHPIGSSKALFFRKPGFSLMSWGELADELLEMARTCDALRIPSPFGMKYRIVAPLVGPSGRSAEVISIWIVGHEDSIPRFVTAYPVE